MCIKQPSWIPMYKQKYIAREREIIEMCKHNKDKSLCPYSSIIFFFLVQGLLLSAEYVSCYYGENGFA